MKQFVLSLFLIGGALGLLTSCSSQNTLTGLNVELTSLENSSDGSVKATVRIGNPTLVAFNIVSAEHKLIVDGRTVGTLKITQPIGMAPQTVAEHVGVVKGASNVARGAGAYRIESKLELRLYGDNTRAIKLQGSGTVAVQ